jgi:anti-anti-sigma regulatory factor
LFQERAGAEDSQIIERQVIFTLSGRMNAEYVAELKALLISEPVPRQIVLDLKDLTLLDRDAVRLLKSCEAESIKLKNCPAYIREWITREGTES